MAYVGLDRGIVDHWIYQDSEYFKVWFEMLFRARFATEPHQELVDGEIVTINYGEFIFGRIKWSDRLRVSEQRLRTLIKKLKAEEMIEVVLEHRKCTLYRIKNYAKFNQQSNQQSDLEPQGIYDTSNQQSNLHPTITQPSVNHQSTTKEESKESKALKKVIKYSVDFESFWDSYPRQIGKLAAFNNYKKLRKNYSAEFLMACAMNYQSFCLDSQTETQFIKMPNNFLNAKDEYFKQFENPVPIVRQQKSGGKVSSFARIQQLAKEEEERESRGHH